MTRSTLMLPLLLSVLLVLPGCAQMLKHFTPDAQTVIVSAAHGAHLLREAQAAEQALTALDFTDEERRTVMRNLMVLESVRAAFNAGKPQDVLSALQATGSNPETAVSAYTHIKDVVITYANRTNAQLPYTLVDYDLSAVAFYAAVQEEIRQGQLDNALQGLEGLLIVITKIASLL